MFSQTTIQEIKQRIDLIDFISLSVGLKKNGKYWKGLCPFHSEKTPSFIVDPAKQIFHCFGCHEGGDLFAFLMKSQKISFAEALQRLAEHAGVALEDDPKSKISSQKRNELWRACEKTADFYHAELKKLTGSHPVKLYLLKRGLTDAEIDKFKLGFAGSNFQQLLQIYKREAISTQLAIEAGILKEGNYGLYETFRDRLVFPIFSKEGKVFGFGGRTLDAEASTAKYINSAQSEIYDKGAILYGLFWALPAIQKTARAIVVEGYLDLIAMHQFGFEEAVAPLGTALTAKQITLLKRYASEIILLFDGDEAGLLAAERLLLPFLEQDFIPKVCFLPSGEDPDSYLRSHDRDDFSERLKKSRNLFEWVTDKTIAALPAGISGRSLAIGKLKPYLDQIKNPFERSLYIRRLADHLHAQEDWVFETLGAAAAVSSRSSKEQESAVSKDLKKPDAEQLLVIVLLRFESLRNLILKSLNFDAFKSEKLLPLVRFLWDDSGWFELSFDLILERYVSSPELGPVLTELAIFDLDLDLSSAQKIAVDSIAKLKERNLKQSLKDLTEKMRQAELVEDQKELDRLLKIKRQMLADLKKSA